MRSPLAGPLALAALAVIACADAPADAARTDETSEGLLASVEAGSLAPNETVDVAALGFDRGSKDAPVRVIEMSDYGCGYCRKFHEETWPALRKEFVESGKIQWKFLPFVTGMFKNSSHASVAAECSLEQGPEIFEKANSRIWGAQKEWKGSDAAGRGAAKGRRRRGVDLMRYDSCVADDRRHDRLAAADELARQVGVRGTPTFFVVGYPPLQGALPTDTFRQLLTMVYADATKGTDGGARP